MLDRQYEIIYRLENSHWWFVAKKKYIKIILDSHLKDRGGNILDVGCGTGGMIELFKNYGRVFGMDRHGTAREYSRQRNKFPLIRGDANNSHSRRGPSTSSPCWMFYIINISWMMRKYLADFSPLPWVYYSPDRLFPFIR